MTAPIAAVDAWMAANKPRLLDELLGFIATPSVSTDPAYAAGMAAAADLLLARLGRIGLNDVRLLDGGGHKAVYGAWTGAAGAPTMLVYGHYDVQPPAPLELWETPPFEPTIRDDRIYARGASDDKSPLWIAVSALEAWLAVHGGLPVNVKVLLEGEEEIGSASLPAIMAAHRDLLAADVLVSADGGRWRCGLPTVNTNSRGIVSLEVHVRTAGRDLHSGRFGGPVGNAADGAGAAAGEPARRPEPHRGRGVFRRAAAAVQRRLRRHGGARLRRGGLLRRHRRPSRRHRARRRPAGIAVAAPDGGSERDLGRLYRRRRQDRHSGRGARQNQLPARPRPGPRARRRRLEAHLSARVPDWADLVVEQTEPGTRAYAVPEDDPFLLAVERVIEQVHGAKPLRVGMGGTLPISAMAKQMLGLETVTLSYAVADENIHAPNEFFRLSSFDDGLKAWPRLLAEIGAMAEGN